MTPGPDAPTIFYANGSPRRLDLARDVNRALLTAATLPDRLEHLPELAKYECFALDGHWHQAAAHDARHDGTKRWLWATSTAWTCAATNSATWPWGKACMNTTGACAKRLKPSGLRQAVPKGRRVLLIYDKAGLDFAYWKRCRQECAVYFLSRVKEGMVYDWLESRIVDHRDQRNRGVTEDRVVMTREGGPMRIIYYTEPEQGRGYEFLTNEMALPPGVLAELYRRRWEVEKVFDELKNKLGQKKAWGTSQVAKAAQGQRVALTHNLLLLYETRLEENHGVSNEAEDERRQERVKQLEKSARQAGREISSLRLSARRATQRSVKFVRWLRQALRENLAEGDAVPRLTSLYATL